MTAPNIAGIVREPGGQLAVRPTCRDDPSLEPGAADAEPLTGLAASAQLKFAVRRLTVEYARLAREEGHSWREIGFALGLKGMAGTGVAEPYTSSQPNARYAATADADGRFTLTEAVSETGDWSVSTTLNGTYWEDWFPYYARAYYGWIDGVSHTRVTGFSLPAKEEAHYAWASGLYATGTAERWNGSS